MALHRSGTLKATHFVYWPLTAAHTAVFVIPTSPPAHAGDYLALSIMLDLAVLSIFSVLFLVALMGQRAVRAQWALLSVVAVLSVMAWHVSRFLAGALVT